MDFGIGFLSNNIMLPILDFFYGIVPSYGLAIVALTLVIRFALYPLNAGSIRNMRRMKVAQPVMQKRVKEVQDRYKDDPAKLQEEMGQIYKEFGNPLAGCFPVLLQMPILFALFATLRGSPFADVSYPVNLHIVPQNNVEQVQPAYSTSPHTIFVSDGEHFPVSAVVPSGDQLAVGETTAIRLQAEDGRSLPQLVDAYAKPDIEVKPRFEVTKGEELVSVGPDGSIEALAPGDVTIQTKVPGLASNKGFLFIKALGRIGVTGDNGEIHWDILGMILFFGLSLYVNQQFSGQAASSDNPQQNAINKFTPLLFSGMFLFFPLPAGVLMYMVIANVFQTVQSFILSREPLPENLQKLVDAETVKTEGREKLAFEPGSPKRAETKANAKGAKPETKSAKTNAKSSNSATKSGTSKKVSKKKS
ncbi:membrane protein insertase YidC [Romeria aff. gracilis LEGE 07310]|uniref:Membrane protein insertase YidC n=1 Tax=Vasconcelosia minhoensis LEGE 07310 TaxID=915328 RepID=A0A8J7AGA4_9CYAN|nr:membrane protein insertase YidC [Romeria gracilis]MBE9078626.1 membrane protein insertase YidC [Romeria aff. gracilis LEGE 07310]